MNYIVSGLDCNAMHTVWDVLEGVGPRLGKSCDQALSCDCVVRVPAFDVRELCGNVSNSEQDAV